MPLQSFLPLRPPPEPAADAPDPEWLVVSGTNLAGMYLLDDPFAPLRATPPQHVLANSVYVYRILNRDDEGGSSTGAGPADVEAGPGG